MKPGRAIGSLVGAVVLATSLLASGLVWAYLGEYGSRQIVLAAVIALVGAGLALGVGRLVSRFCRSRGRAAIVLALVLLVVAAPLVSMRWPGRVTYARFGLTVYGIVPVPMLDVTVGPNGVLWFRDKSHFVSLEEVERLLAPGVEEAVIGIGWESAVRVDPAVLDLEGVEVRVLPTPEAFKAFNRSVSEAHKVVLIAHSTC